MEHSLLKSTLLEKTTPIIKTFLKYNDAEIFELYQELEHSINDHDWSKTISSDFLEDSLIEFKDSSGLGLDLPIWFDWETEKKKVMIIGRDPQRNHNDNRLILGSPFGIANENGRETKKNKYWNFIKPLLQENRIYITDVFKLFIKDTQDRKNLKKKKSYHYNILKEELEIIQPDIIITIGKDAEIAVSKILDCNRNEPFCIHNGIDIYFIPHISNMVLQNLIPIANLFRTIGRLKNDNDLENIGNNIISNKEALFK